MQLFQDEFVTDIHPYWVAWLRAFWYQTPISQINRTEITRHVLVACRWLARHYPEVTEPSQWTKEVAFQYVAYVCNEATVFDYASSYTRQLFAKKLEKNQEELLKPASQSSRLKGMRAFFRALQKYSYEINGHGEPPLSVGWNPAVAFATPEYVTARLQPNPRNIEEEAWLKLVWTACTLTAEMVKEAVPQTTYPLLLQRAVALVWVTGCRRSDEICRLSLECVRHEWAPEMINEQGVQLEAAENLWYLRVPTNKFRGEFWRGKRFDLPTNLCCLIAKQASSPNICFNIVEEGSGKHTSPPISFLYCARQPVSPMSRANHTGMPSGLLPLTVLVRQQRTISKQWE
jgi:integrase